MKLLYQSKSTLLLVLSILWMAVIFMFSSQPAEQSTETSLKMGTMIGNVVVEDFSELPELEQRAYAKRIEFPVRKVAHASEFALLGILLTVWLATGERERYQVGGWLIGTLYAVTDEFHQLFVPGRSCQLTDVIIDSGGCLLGCLLIYLIECNRGKKSFPNLSK